MFKSIIFVVLVTNSLVLVSSTAPPNPPMQCCEGEVYVECPDMSKPVNCSQLGHSLPVPGPGHGCPTEPACLCASGFLRNDEGVCIPIDKCPACGDDPNAKPGCGFNFGKRCSNKDPITDSDLCGLNACECKPGYVYDEIIRKCVLPNQCRPVCGENEQYSDCVNGGCFGARKCSQLGAQVKCFLPKYCIKGCLCKKGYLRNADRKCIPENKCCESKNHEYYSNCTNGGCFGERSCSELGRPEKCYKTDPLNCKKGCICEKGYLRNGNGVCVLRKRCPRKCTKPNEVFEECPETCPLRTCGIDDRLFRCGKPLKVGDPNCPLPACRCADGYFRTPNGFCVRWKECPPPPCGRNEVYVECPDISQPSNCSQLGFPLPVPVASPDEECPTKPGCVCAKGHVRNAKGFCIPMNKCPSCGGDPNATCGTHFGRRCSNYQTGPVLFPQVCSKNACDCKPDYVYDENIKKCVLPKDCTSVCGVNETYVSCPSYQWPRKCSQLGYEMPLIAPTPDGKCPTKPGCICLNGYVRDGNGVCIPIDKCQSCGGDPNAKSGCGNCGRLCSNYKDEVVCTKICRLNDCECRPGFVFDVNLDKCVNPKHCTPVCGANEYYSNCTNGGCFGARNCSQIGAPEKCYKIDPKYCIKGCLCKKGYLRNANGKCVPEDQCCDCNKHEAYSNCTNGGCFGARKCSEKGLPEKCYKIDPANCKKGCICEKGYLRNHKGVCIPKNKCPQKCTNPHERWDRCPKNCPPQTCESIGKEYDCPLPNKHVCKGACRCKKGYYRNKIGQCISREQCLKCPGQYEYWSCGGACDNVCADMSLQNQTSCPVVNVKCNEKCYCVKGYARNANKICVPFKDCEPKCGVNEVYSRCANGGCFNASKCFELGGPLICVDPVKCEGGCVCKEGYYLNDKDVCISEKECRANCGKNEIFSNCTLGLCRNELCSQRNNPTMCPAVIPLPCEKGCVCQKFFLRAPNGTCVPENECPPESKCGVNEYYDYCPPSCSPQLCDKRIQIKCLPSAAVCRPSCRCKKGHLRNIDGICVPEDKCGCNGDPNAEHGKGGNCGRLCSNYDSPEPIACDHLEQSDGCICKEGYVFDSHTGRCVLHCDCSPETRNNEIYSTCVEAECRAIYCVDKDDPVHCPAVEDCDCSEGHVCRPGYYRTYNGTCVHEDKCDEEYYDD